MKNIHVCRWCKRMYTGLNDQFCPECVKKMDEAFVIIRTNLDDHRGASAARVAAETNLDSRIVIQLLKDERLSEYTGERLECEICHKRIYSGRLCAECKKTMETLVERKSDSPKENLRPTFQKPLVTKGQSGGGYRRAAKSLRMREE